MTRMAGGVLRVAAAALAAVFIGPAGIAMAETPTPASSGILTLANNSTPGFGGVVKFATLVSPLDGTCFEAPVIDGQPAERTVTAPSGASFTVGEGPIPTGCSAATIQWEVSIDHGGLWEDVSGGNVSGATSPTLTIESTSTSESGNEYRAALTNESALPPTDSNPATLTVEAPPPPPCSEDPAITEQPTNETVIAPATATFTASASTPPNCKAPTVQWYSKAPSASSFSPIGGARSDSYTTPATNTDE